MRIGAPSWRQPVGRLARLARRVVWALGLVFFAGVALAATVVLGYEMLLAGRAAGIIPVAITLAAVVGLTALGIIQPAPMRSHPLATGLAVLAVSRLVAVALIPSPVFSDFHTYHRLAIEFTALGPVWHDRPPGWPAVLGVGYAIFGPNPVVGELMCLSMAVVTGWLVYDIGLRTFGQRGAALALWLYAIAPAQVVYIVVLGSEALYATLLAAAVWAVVRFGWIGLLAGAAAGALLGAGQYVRAETPAFVAAFLAAAILQSGRPARLGRVAVALVISFVVVLAPVIAHNLETQGEVSVSTSHWQGWSLLVGTATGNEGGFDPELAKAVGGQPGSIEFDKRAMSLAVAHIRDDPLGVAFLAVRKVRRMWATDNYGVQWPFNPKAPAAALMAPSVPPLLRVASQAAYAMVVLMAAVSLLRQRTIGSTVLLILLIFLASAAAHTVLEVQPRYHAYLVPLMCVLAGGCLPIRAGRPDPIDAVGTLDEPTQAETLRAIAAKSAPVIEVRLLLMQRLWSRISNLDTRAATTANPSASVTSPDAPSATATGDCSTFCAWDGGSVPSSADWAMSSGCRLGPGSAPAVALQG